MRLAITARLKILVAVAAIGLSPVAVRADDASRLALAKELMTQIHASDTMRALLPILSAQMRVTLAQQGHDDAETREYVAQFETRVSAEVGRFTDDMAAAYAQAFTDDELKGLLAFDETPLGRKLIARTPELSQASLLAGHKLGMEVGKEVFDDMQAKKDRAKSQQKL